MKTKAVRLYGKEDLRLEEIELPAITADEILAKVVSDSICMSSYKAAKQGPYTNGARTMWLKNRLSLATNLPAS